MDRKIKICFYAHTVDFAGTWRSHERIALNLNRDLFDVYIIYREEADNNRMGYLLENFDKDKLIKFNAPMKKTGPEDGYSFIETNFFDVISKYDFDIFHFARGGYYEWPFIKRFCPIQIETNIFGYNDKSDFLDCSITISETVNRLRGGSDHIVFNPIPKENNYVGNLKKDLNIDDECLVFGRIGRKDNFHPISLNVLSLFKNLGYKFKFIIVGACEKTINTINNLNLQNECIIVETTNDDNFIDRFHKTIDIFLHYRSDGETFGTAIAQSMMFGNPVISHYAGYNAQSEIIKEGGYVSNDENDYLNELIKLVNNKDYYNFRSKKAKERSIDFDENKITREIEQIYINLYNKLKNVNN